MHSVLITQHTTPSIYRTADIDLNWEMRHGWGVTRVGILKLGFIGHRGRLAAGQLGVEDHALTRTGLQ